MLLPRWFSTHRQLRCALLLREFHATPTCLRMYFDPCQIDPITAEARTYPSHPKNKYEKSKKTREGKQKRRKPIIKGRSSTSGKLSSLLRLQDNSSRSTRSKVERPFGPRPRTLPGRLSGNKDIDGVLPYPFFCRLFFICFPAQSISDRDLGNEPRLPRSLHYSRRVDGVFQPRASSDPFLEGKVLPPEPAGSEPQIA